MCSQGAPGLAPPAAAATELARGWRARLAVSSGRPSASWDPSKEPQWGRLCTQRGTVPRLRAGLGGGGSPHEAVKPSGRTVFAPLTNAGSVTRPRAPEQWGVHVALRPLCLRTDRSGGEMQDPRGWAMVGESRCRWRGWREWGGAGWGVARWLPPPRPLTACLPWSSESFGFGPHPPECQGLFSDLGLHLPPLSPRQLQQTEAELRKVDEAITLFQKML